MGGIKTELQRIEITLFNQELTIFPHFVVYRQKIIPEEHANKMNVVLKS